MAEENFFKTRAYVNKRVDAETAALREEVLRLQRLLELKEQELRKLNDEIQALRHPKSGSGNRPATPPGVAKPGRKR